MRFGAGTVTGFIPVDLHALSRKILIWEGDRGSATLEDITMTFEKINWLIFGFALGYLFAMGLIWFYRSMLDDLQKDVIEELKKRLELKFKK